MLHRASAASLRRVRAGEASPARRRAPLRPARGPPGRPDRRRRACARATACRPSSACAEAHGVSRTVVREAVHQLRSRGLVRSRQGSGMFVTAAPTGEALTLDLALIGSVDDVLLVREVRRALEAESAALAAERATRAQVAACARRCARSTAAPPSTATASPRTSPSIACSPSPPATRTSRACSSSSSSTPHEAMRVTRRNDATRADFVEAVRHEHAAIVDAIAAGDAPSARGARHPAHAPRRPAHAHRRADRRRTEENPPMKILITGGGGFVGSRLAAALLARGRLGGATIERIVLADQVAPRAALTATARVEARVGPLAGAVRGTRPGRLRRRVPSRLGRLRRMRGRLRPRPALQPRHDARAARRAARGDDARRDGRAIRLLELGRGVRARSVGAAARPRRRRHAARAEDLVRHAQAGVRAPDRRLFAQGLRRRPLGAPDDGHRATGQAERRRLVVLLRDHPRAARRRSKRSARSRPRSRIRSPRRRARSKA